MGFFDLFKKKKKSFICAKCKKEITVAESNWITNHRFCSDCAAPQKVTISPKQAVDTSVTTKTIKVNTISTALQKETEEAKCDVTDRTIYSSSCKSPNSLYQEVRIEKENDVFYYMTLAMTDGYYTDGERRRVPDSCLNNDDIDEAALLRYIATVHPYLDTMCEYRSANEPTMQSPPKTTQQKLSEQLEKEGLSSLVYFFDDSIRPYYNTLGPPFTVYVRKRINGNYEIYRFNEYGYMTASYNDLSDSEVYEKALDEVRDAKKMVDELHAGMGTGIRCKKACEDGNNTKNISDIPSSKSDPQQFLRSKIIEYLMIYQRTTFPLGVLDFNKKYFQGYSMVSFELDLIEREIFADVCRYLNHSGRYKKDRYKITTSFFYQMPKKSQVSEELRYMKTDEDWNALFDDKLKIVVERTQQLLKKMDPLFNEVASHKQLTSKEGTIPAISSNWSITIDSSSYQQIDLSYTDGQYYVSWYVRIHNVCNESGGGPILDIADLLLHEFCFVVNSKLNSMYLDPISADSLYVREKFEIIQNLIRAQREEKNRLTNKNRNSD